MLLFVYICIIKKIHKKHIPNNLREFSIIHHVVIIHVKQLYIITNKLT